MPSKKPNQGTGATAVPNTYLPYLALRPPDFRALVATWGDPVARRRGLAVYEEMLADPMVAASLDLLKWGALSLEWTVAPANDGDHGAHALAEEVGEVLDRWPGGFREFLYQALTALDYGYSITEVVWGANSEKRWVPIKWTPLPQALYGFKVSQEGEIEGVIPFLRQLSKAEPYPLEAFFILRWNARYGSPYGRSQLYRAYEPWWTKQLLRRMRSTALDRYGSPLMVVKVPPNAPESDRRALKEWLENLYAEAGLIVSNNYEVHPAHTGAAGSIAEGFQRAIEYEDAQIAKAITGVVLNANESRGTGTYAQSRVHQENFLYWVRRVKNMLEEAVQEQIVKRYVAYNYGGDVKPPYFTIADPETENATLAATAIQTGLALGVVKPDMEFGWIREKLGLPPASEKVAAAIRGEQPEEGEGGWADLLSLLTQGE